MKIENKIIKTELFKWRDLIPLQPKNFKELSKANYEKLKTSIINNNFVMSFTVWDSGAGVFIIDGVHRFKVLDLLEKEGAEIPELLPCTFIQCENKKEASKLVLIYSSIYAKTQDEGLYEFLNLEGLDFEALKIEIDIPNIDLENFELGYFKETDEEKLNDVPDIQDKAISETGDLFLIGGKHRVMCGDSLNIQDTEKLLNGNKIDLLFTDPPYGVSYGDKNKYLNVISPANRIQTPIENDHKTEQETNDFWYNYFLIVKQFLNNIHSYYIFSPQIQGMMMMMMMMMKAEMPYRHVLIWNKNNHVLGRTDYNYKHEPMLYGWTKEGTHRFYGKGENTKSVWDYNKPHKSDLHPTMKPVKLIVNAILNSSLKNQIVSDSFLGSGSTLIASEQTNRICYGMEIDPIYIDVILKRYKKLYPDSEFKCLNREFDFGTLFNGL